MNKFIFSMGSGYSVLKRCSGTSFTQILIPFCCECHFILNFSLPRKGVDCLLLGGECLYSPFFSKIKEIQNNNTI